MASTVRSARLDPELGRSRARRLTWEESRGGLCGLMHIDFLLDVFRANDTRDAIVWREQSISYGWLVDAVDRWSRSLADASVAPGTVVSLECDFSPTAIALLLALVERG